MLAAYLVANHIPGILSNARKPHVWTLARQIVVHPPREVAVVRETDEAHDESPDVPLHNVLVTVRLVLGQKAADSTLGRSWNTVCKSEQLCHTCIFCEIVNERLFVSILPAGKSPLSRGVTGKRKNIWTLEKPQLIQKSFLDGILGGQGGLKNTYRLQMFLQDSR